ncbi:MAG: UDPGP type 1 family protein [Myxococcota bacterium]
MSKGPATADFQELKARFEAQGQGHVFAFWEQLDPSGQERLGRQLASLDLEGLIRGFQATRSHASGTPSLEPPEVVALPEHGGDAKHWAEAEAAGESLLRDGRAAVMVVAGGQASRLGYPGPKGLYPLGPASGRTLFALQAQKLLHLRARTGAAIPWYVMTSPATDAATRDGFAAEGFFGVPERDVFFLCQGMVPSFDFDGKLMLEKPDRVFENPDGHGGSLTALLDSGALDDMERRGISTIFYYQVDNPMLPLGDPVFLGHHARARAEMSCKMLRKREPGEKMGVLARVDGAMGVVEYTEINDEQRNARDAQGELLYGAGNVAVHALEVSFVRRIASDAERWLPFHASAKKIPQADAKGATQTPAAENGFKLERFVFDALPAAKDVCVVEAPRSEYSPVKNASGGESPETSRRDLSQRYRGWLEAAGLPAPAGNGWVEIDESKIGSPEDLRALGLERIEDAPDLIQLRVGDDA